MRILAMVCALTVGSLVLGADVKFEKTDSSIAVTLDGKPFTTYRFKAEASGTALYLRPFFYPVLASDGVCVTEDKAISKGGDSHPHHRSLWVAHGSVNGVDHWMMKSNTAPKQRTEKIDAAGDTITEELVWEGATPDAVVLKEARTWKFFTFADGHRGIDLTSTYTAPTAPAVFGDTKEAGLCSVRLNNQIAAASTITTGAGVSEKGSAAEKLAWGKPAPWCDESGKIDGKDYGVAILDHPSNPKYPSTWHVRAYGLMTANIFGLHDFDRKAAKGAGDFTVEPGKPVTFKYRIVVHTGDAKSADLETKHKEWAK